MFFVGFSSVGPFSPVDGKDVSRVLLSWTGQERLPRKLLAWRGQEANPFLVGTGMPVVRLAVGRKECDRRRGRRRSVGGPGNGSLREV